MVLNSLMRMDLRRLTVLAVSLYTLRVICTLDIRFVFLNWNLFLAWLPLYLAGRSVNSSDKRIGSAFALAWFILLPNSFYIFTDLIHLKWSSEFWKWYDGLLILVYALAAARYGFLSIGIMQEKLQKVYRWFHADNRGGHFSLLLICSFGVYIGRMGRWNSWDLLYRPLDVAEYVLHITRLSTENMGMFIFTGLFWLFLVLVFVASLQLKNRYKTV